MRGEPLSLTGPDSHRLVREPGAGGLTIGPGDAVPRPDLVVGPADRIDWAVFDPFTVPAGYPWPRVFRYDGDDTGFFAWSRRRRIESFSWQPRAAHYLDVSSARIDNLAVTVHRAPVHLVVAENQRHLAFAGDLSLLSVDLADGAGCPTLGFLPATTAARDAGPVGLPPMPAFAGARSVDVKVRPLRQPFDCASLVQFPGLRHLALAGSLTGLPALAGLRELTSLHLRYCPDLTELPELDTWPGLTDVIAFNVEETTGKRLRRSGRARVSQLRKPAWFSTGYGLPFSAWPARTARAATTAYRAAAGTVTAATAPGDVEQAVRVFVAAINKLPGIETTEREDAAEAVAQLTASTPLGDLRDAAARWFDTERDF
ncbi:hypothetical protein [Actinoplanes sp. NPDC051494]|uniref:hypothetical protein n=1 Tax=Actinoplanes sp. NPDC051494 TaxID=3363907 RepID=UPI0037AC60FB